jgi:hypothetical protein
MNSHLCGKHVLVAAERVCLLLHMRAHSLHVQTAHINIMFQFILSLVPSGNNYVFLFFNGRYYV